MPESGFTALKIDVDIDAYGYRDLLGKQAVNIIMPDIPRCGGLSECRKIANMAEIHYIPFGPHNVSSPLGTLASAHVCTTVPNFLVLEFHGRDIAWWEDLCEGDKPFLQQGWMRVSERPGIGVELNDEVARSLLWNGDTYFD